MKTSTKNFINKVLLLSFPAFIVSVFIYIVVNEPHILKVVL
jgi:hypothetical protein